jgi:hypothetical protein
MDSDEFNGICSAVWFITWLLAIWIRPLTNEFLLTGGLCFLIALFNRPNPNEDHEGNISEYWDLRLEGKL